jgi:hypothetical protein
VIKTAQTTKEKVSQIKDHVASTLGTSYEKPQKDDETHCDAAEKEYDSSIGLISEQLKHLATKFFGTMEQKIGEITENAQEKKLEKQKRVLVQL